MLAQSHFLCKSFLGSNSATVSGTTSSTRLSFLFSISPSSSAAPLSRNRISFTMALNSKRPDLNETNSFRTERIRARSIRRCGNCTSLTLPVKIPLYGCDCYAYALLASRFVDLAIESGLKPYDFLALVPVIEGGGGSITDVWEGSSSAVATSFNVVAAGDSDIHQQALESLEWQ